MWNYIQDLLPTVSNKQFLVFKHQANTYIFNQAIYFNNSWWVMQTEQSSTLYTQDPTVLKKQIIDIAEKAGQESNIIIGWLQLPDDYINLYDFVFKSDDENQEIKGDN